MRRMTFQATFNSFAWQSIEVEDTIGAYTNGVWEEVMLGNRRTIRAIPFAMKPEELELYSDGSASTAGITLTTPDYLFWSDIMADVQEQKQSYVLWQGWRWRVMGNNLMIGNVDKLLIYSAVRFIR